MIAPDLLDAFSRKLACCIVYIGSSPLRLIFASGLTLALPIFIPLALLVDLHDWGCNHTSKPDWNDWTVLEFPKLTYWDFLILGKWPKL